MLLCLTVWHTLISSNRQKEEKRGEKVLYNRMHLRISYKNCVSCHPALSFVEVITIINHKKRKER